jgi:hypothetical protein
MAGEFSTGGAREKSGSEMAGRGLLTFPPDFEQRADLGTAAGDQVGYGLLGSRVERSGSNLRRTEP